MFASARTVRASDGMKSEAPEARAHDRHTTYVLPKFATDAPVLDS